MRVPPLISLSAVFLALLGLFLVLQTGVALGALGYPASPADGAADPAAMAYWRATAFARLFGVTLLAFGMVLWHVKPLIGAGAERRIGLTLAAGFALVGLIALAQQIAVFGTPAGWGLSGAFLGLAAVTAVAAFRPTAHAP